MNDLETKDPIYVDIQLPPVNDKYRYLKVLVHDTFDTSKEDGINRNLQEYFTLQELEVYVKEKIHHKSICGGSLVGGVR